MKTQWHKVWESRSPRDRKIFILLTALVVIVLYGWLVQSGGREYTRLRASVATLRVQAAVLQQQAAELERLRAIPPKAASTTELRTLIQGQADAAGFPRETVKIDAVDANQVVVVFGAIGIADWLNWVNRLQTQQVRLASCRIQALSTPGTVSITATLLRTPHS